MASAGGIFAFAGSLLNAGGQVNESQNRAYALESEAIAADQSAELAVQGGIYNARRQNIEAQKQQGSLEADIAASGVESDSTSALDVLRESHMNAELDHQNILYGSQMTAMNYRNAAAAARSGAKSAIKAGRQKAFATIFDGAAEYADRAGGGSKKNRATGFDSIEASRQYRDGKLRYDSGDY